MIVCEVSPLRRLEEPARTVPIHTLETDTTAGNPAQMTGSCTPERGRSIRRSWEAPVRKRGLREAGPQGPPSAEASAAGTAAHSQAPRLAAVGPRRDLTR